MSKIYDELPAAPYLKGNGGQRGAFQRTLREDLITVDQSIEDCLKVFSEQRQIFRTSICPTFDLKDNDLLTVREFFTNFFRLNRKALANNLTNDTNAQVVRKRLNFLLDEAEDCFSRHLILEKISGTELGCKMRLTGIWSNDTVKFNPYAGSLPKHNFRFSVLEFESELEEAGAGDITVKPLESDAEILRVYHELPQAVKDLFFAVSYRGQLARNLPLFLVREILLFSARDKWWEKLKQGLDPTDKKQSYRHLEEFFLAFAENQRKLNGFSLGTAIKAKNREKLTIKQIALLDFFKPHFWIGKLHRTIK